MTDDTTAEAAFYRIDQVAARTGLTKRTLRYYEEIGLLAPPARTEGNYRLYSADEVAKLERIAKLKEALGLTLAELTDLMRMEDARLEIKASFQEAHDPTEQIAQLDRAETLVREQLDLVERKLRTLTELRTALTDRLARYATLRAELAEQ